MTTIPTDVTDAFEEAREGPLKDLPVSIRRASITVGVGSAISLLTSAALWLPNAVPSHDFKVDDKGRYFARVETAGVAGITTAIAFAFLIQGAVARRRKDLTPL